MTSQSRTFFEFFLYFGLLVCKYDSLRFHVSRWCLSLQTFVICFTAIGTDLVMAAFHLALNTYFVNKRGIATGIAMSFTGIGPIIMPLVVSGLLGFYGVSETGLILSAVSLHSFVAALLLQPVRWHRKRINSGRFFFRRIYQIIEN